MWSQSLIYKQFFNFLLFCREEETKESPVSVDTGDVYLGYPNNIVVPIITQTAPSEQSLEMEIIDDAEIKDETKEAVRTF